VKSNSNNNESTKNENQNDQQPTPMNIDDLFNFDIVYNDDYHRVSHEQLHMPLIATSSSFSSSPTSIKASSTTKSTATSKISIVSIDPFTGDVNMWDCWEKQHRDQRKWVFRRNEKGRPTIYDRPMWWMKDMLT